MNSLTYLEINFLEISVANISLFFINPTLHAIRCLKMYKNRYKSAIHNNVKRILGFQLHHFLFLPLRQRLFGFCFLCLEEKILN